jgi:hypothetical protein
MGWLTWHTGRWRAIDYESGGRSWPVVTSLRGNFPPFNHLLRGLTWLAIVSVCYYWRAVRTVVAQFDVELAEETFLGPGRILWLCCAAA